MIKLSMVNITVNLPDRYISAIEDLIELGIYKTKSGTIRKAIGRLLKSDFGFFDDLLYAKEYGKAVVRHNP